MATILNSALANRVIGRLLEAAARTRGRSNAALMSAFLYRIEHATQRGDDPLDALALRFWDELQRMDMLSKEGCLILSGNGLANRKLARRFQDGVNVIDRQHGGSFWISMKSQIEQEARSLNWI